MNQLSVKKVTKTANRLTAQKKTTASQSSAKKVTRTANRLNAQKKKRKVNAFLMNAQSMMIVSQSSVKREKRIVNLKNALKKKSAYQLSAQRSACHGTALKNHGCAGRSNAQQSFTRRLKSVTHMSVQQMKMELPLASKSAAQKSANHTNAKKATKTANQLNALHPANHTNVKKATRTANQWSAQRSVCLLNAQSRAPLVKLSVLNLSQNQSLNQK